MVDWGSISRIFDTQTSSSHQPCLIKLLFKYKVTTHTQRPLLFMESAQLDRRLPSRLLLLMAFRSGCGPPLASTRLASLSCKEISSSRALSSSSSSKSGSNDKLARFSLTRQSKPTFPRQFATTGVHCGIKKNAALDLALILSTSSHKTAAAASFTKNAFQAAPVTVSKEVLQHSSEDVRALVVNSGCANAVTGQQGLDNAWAMARAVQGSLLAYKNQDKPNVLVMSTGVIGQQIPIKRIAPAITSTCFPTLSDSFESWDAAAKAFMTTDTFPKLRTKETVIPGQGRETPIRFAGIDKGAGMIHPRMGPPGPPHATLLGLVATDATVEPAALQKALDYAIDRSFNSISVDGDTSTNDTVALLANGAAWGGKEAITLDGPGFVEFREALTEFMTDLASLIVWDGEGATKFVSINVEVSSLSLLRTSADAERFD